MGKVLITEKVHPIGPQLLRAAGHQVVQVENRDMAQIAREIVDADAVIVRIIDLPGSLLKTAEHLRIVSKHGVGIDNIDLDYCREAGVAVTVTPNANSLSVAEHAFTLMLTLAKNIIPVSNAYREIGFAAKNSGEGVEATGKTVGVIGFGCIGSHFAKMAHGAFDARILAYDPYVSEMPAWVERAGSPEQIFREADFVSLHANLTDETRRLVNRERLALMKPGAFLINCARGPMVDEAALIEALRSGRIAGAGLDVTDPEPVAPESPLFAMPNVIVTPHYAPTTIESATRVSRIAAQNTIAVLAGKGPVGRII